ncbi:MAG TPA: hypothetical protein VFX00_10925 [Pedococcus sp.]|nr:hypothetical protein [Pedococcus sp.]
MLACFLLAQVDRVNPAGHRYLVTNLVGSGAMRVTAATAGEWGFVFLEGIWALVSAWGSAPAWAHPAGGALMALALQFVGALGILVPFALMQFRRTTAHSWLYLSLNSAGSVILTWLALTESQWGFVLLQGVWALAALVGLVRRATR